MPAFPQDWLILAGDVGETAEHLEFALRFLSRRFAQILWTPGNHDLWTLPRTGDHRRGEAKYQHLVEICRRYGVLTPEDPYPIWSESGFEAILAPIFVLYDYSFRPDDVPEDQALAWAAETDLVCADELLLHADPYRSRGAWCEARCRLTEERLHQAADGRPFIIVSHFPLSRDLAVLPRIPRFSIWCGTRRTEPWLERFPIKVAIYGHLHIRNTLVRHGIRFEEVSLGYPNQWDQQRGVASYLRRIQLEWVDERSDNLA